MCDQQSLRQACTYVQSDQSFCKSFEYSMSVTLLTEHNLDFLSLKGCCIGSSESTLVKMPHCWKTHVTTHFASSVQQILVLFHAIFEYDMNKAIFLISLNLINAFNSYRALNILQDFLDNNCCRH